jgi:hypothetical protein
MLPAIIAAISALKGMQGKAKQEAEIQGGSPMQAAPVQSAQAAPPVMPSGGQAIDPRTQAMIQALRQGGGQAQQPPDFSQGQFAGRGGY